NPFIGSFTRFQDLAHRLTDTRNLTPETHTIYLSPTILRQPALLLKSSVFEEARELSSCSHLKERRHS
ncbi:MAG: hypothetical protein PVG26_24635, partial [Desulfobacterales bacterium]